MHTPPTVVGEDVTKGYLGQRAERVTEVVPPKVLARAPDTRVRRRYGGVPSDRALRQGELFEKLDSRDDC